MAAACPPGSRGCDSLLQLSPHMHARPENSSYGNRGGPREAIEAKRGLWKVRRTGRLLLQHVSLFTDFTLAYQHKLFGLTNFELLMCLMVFYIVLGCFLDGISSIVLTMAVIEPMIRKAGIDVIWFGIFLTVLGRVPIHL